MNIYLSRKRKRFVLPNPNYKFICGDARYLEDMNDKSFDIVVVRHPNICGQGRSEWRPILEEATRVSVSPSLFIGTTYSDDEHEILRELVEGLSYYIRIDELNPYTFFGGINGETLFDRKVLFATA